MDNVEEIIEQIKILSEFVTEDTYNTRVTQGYELLVKLHDFVVGFCQPEKWIWNEDCAKKR